MNDEERGKLVVLLFVGTTERVMRLGDEGGRAHPHPCPLRRYWQCDLCTKDAYLNSRGLVPR